MSRSLEWALFGTPQLADSPALSRLLLRALGATTERLDLLEDDSYKFLSLCLDERYDPHQDAMFYLEAELELEDGAFSFITTYLPLRGEDLKPASQAAWSDATSALMSYYGTGEAERSHLGFGP